MVLRHRSQPGTREYQSDRASRTASRTATHPADHNPEQPTQMRKINDPHLTTRSPYQAWRCVRRPSALLAAPCTSERHGKPTPASEMCGFPDRRGEAGGTFPASIRTRSARAIAVLSTGRWMRLSRARRARWSRFPSTVGRSPRCVGADANAHSAVGRPDPTEHRGGSLCGVRRTHRAGAADGRRRVVSPAHRRRLADRSYRWSGVTLVYGARLWFPSDAGAGVVRKDGVRSMGAVAAVDHESTRPVGDPQPSRHEAA